MPKPVENEGDHDDAPDEPGSEVAPRTSRAAARRRSPASRSGSYDSWTVPELRKRAKELGMTGYSALSKSDLIFALRNQ